MQSLTIYHMVIRIVQKISRQWMSDVLHVHPNLMGSSGFQPDSGKGISICHIQPPEMGYGRFTAVKIHHPFHGAVMSTGNGCVNGAGFRQNPGTNRTVFPMDVPVSHLFCQNTGGELMPGKQHQTGGVPVQSAYGTCSKRFLQLLVIIRQPIGQRVRIMSL